MWYNCKFIVFSSSIKRVSTPTGTCISIMAAIYNLYVLIQDIGIPNHLAIENKMYSNDCSEEMQMISVSKLLVIFLE